MSKAPSAASIGHLAIFRGAGQPSASPVTAPTPTSGIAAGAIALQAVTSDASTSAVASPSGTSNTPTFTPARRSASVPQPAPTAASTSGNRTHERISDKGAPPYTVVRSQRLGPAGSIIL